MSPGQLLVEHSDAQPSSYAGILTIDLGTDPY